MTTTFYFVLEGKIDGQAITWLPVGSTDGRLQLPEYGNDDAIRTQR